MAAIIRSITRTAINNLKRTLDRPLFGAGPAHARHGQGHCDALPVCGAGAVCGHEVQPRSGRKMGAQDHVRAAGAVGRVADCGESVKLGGKQPVLPEKEKVPQSVALGHFLIRDAVREDYSNA